MYAIFTTLVESVSTEVPAVAAHTVSNVAVFPPPIIVPLVCRFVTRFDLACLLT